MIFLEVQPYCQNCLDFQAVVEHPDTLYASGEIVERGDTIVRCANRRRCESLVRYLKRRVEKETITMTAVFIGEDGSMGLKRGEKYDISIYSDSMTGHIIVDWGIRRCPYSNLMNLARNWRGPEKGENDA